MTADQTVERAASQLQRLANQLAGEGGFKARLAQLLAEDADLIRKMKPTLIKARAKGAAQPPVRDSGPVEGVRGTREVPPNAAQPPVRDGGAVEGVRGNREIPATARTPSPSAPRLSARPKAKKKGAGPSPWIVVGAALAAGIVLAKWIDWRGYA